MKSKFIIVFFLSLVSLCNAQTVYLYTPNGSQVYAFKNPEMSSYDIAYYTEQYASLYPNAEILANASSTYNCHSYAWNLTEGGTTICWLNQSPDLHLYWDDGSYEQVTEANAVKIFYYNGDHSAVKSITHAGKYESKWGSMPLMRHSPEYGPAIYNMQYRRYYGQCSLVIQNQTITSNRNILSCGTIEIKNTTISSGATVNIHAQESVTLKPGSHAVAGSNVRITAGGQTRASSSPDNSLPLENDDAKSFSLSEELTVEIIETTGVDFSVFPNPNDGNFTVKIEGEIQPYTIEIFNNLGR